MKAHVSDFGTSRLLLIGLHLLALLDTLLQVIFLLSFPSKFIIWLKNVRYFFFSRTERDHSFFCRICLAKVDNKTDVL